MDSSITRAMGLIDERPKRELLIFRKLPKKEAEKLRRISNKVILSRLTLLK